MRLVVGYGNTLRRDDGVAAVVCAEVAARGLAGVRVEVVHELVPEVAAWVAEADGVVFVDAAVDGSGVTVRPVGEPDGASPLSHAGGPAEVVRLAERAYGRRVEAWVVTVGVVELGVGEGLSADVAALVPRAVDAVVQLVAEIGR